MSRYPTPASLLAGARADLAAATRRHGDAKAAAANVLDRAQRTGRGWLSAAETAHVAEARRQRHDAWDAITSARERIATLTEIEAEEATYMRNSAVPARQDRGTATFSIGRNERVYRPDTDPHGRGFLFDVANNFLRADPVASERLSRHMEEERVDRGGLLERAPGDATTASWSGLVVPQYLTDLYAPQIASLRPFADLCCVHIPLPPDGMTVNFSKITTGSSVALQSAELATVASVSMDDSLGQAPVQTFAGSQNVSRQAIERGTGIEAATLQDLMRKYATTLDSTLINQATTGLAAVAQAVTYTSASPTAAEFYPYLYQAASKVEQALLGVSYPSHVVMAARRWNWFAAGLTNTLPIVSSAGVPPQSAGFALNMGTGDLPAAVRAVLASGLKVVVDENVPKVTGGTQDEIYVIADTETMYLAEVPNAPLMIRAEQPNAAQLGILYVLYSYGAYFSRYANPAAVIKGTGTVAPAGF